MVLKKQDLIFVAGHNGFLGKSILRRLKLFRFQNILTADKKKLDLKDQKKVFIFLSKYRPKAIIIAAAKTGGIYFNSKFGPEILYDNLSIQNNLIEGAKRNNIQNIIFLASNTIYPKFTKQPMKEKDLFSGSLEKSHEYFSFSKLAGIKLCEAYNKKYNTNYKTLILPNVYGPGDNYDTETSSFFPALIKKIYDAKIINKKNISLWGNGKSKREIIYVDDVADACIYFLKKKVIKHVINIGSNKELKIKDFAKFIMKEMKVNLKIIFKDFKSAGMKRKLLDISISRKYGWRHKVNLKQGFKLTLDDFLKKNN
jgi:GDP-L-fucose synthase